MRALFYHSASHWSGASRAFAVGARGLAAAGETVVVACAAEGSAQRGFERAGLDVHAMAISSSVSRDAWRLRGILKERSPDLLFVQGEREQTIANSAMRLGTRRTVVRRIAPDSSAMGGPSGNLVARAMSTRLLFATEQDRSAAGAGPDAFVAPYGVNAATSENARDASRAALGIKDGTQLIVGVTDDRSGIRVTTMLRTLALLADRHPDLRLVLVGRFEDLDDTRMHAAALGVVPLVKFLDERDDMSSILAAADVGWVGAAGDDAAFACLDFMSARVPVIAHESPLTAHLAPSGVVGTLLPEGETNEIASAVARFLSDGTQRVAMGVAGRARVVRDFGEAAMIDGFLAAAGVRHQVPVVA